MNPAEMLGRAVERHEPWDIVIMAAAPLEWASALKRRLAGTTCC
jgi:hypothetical protein